MKVQQMTDKQLTARITAYKAELESRKPAKKEKEKPAKKTEETPPSAA